MKKWLIVLVCLALAAPAYAKPKNKHYKAKKVPPGLVKKVVRGKSLPPGWQKKLVRGEVLDGDIYLHAAAISEKERHAYGIPLPPKGVKVLKVENKIIRLMEATRTILDVFEVK